jgi:periplasmic protein TonB
MKRNEKRVPEFDEIIFENRNKTYGAYDLRKHYNSAASLSIIAGAALSTLLVTAFSFKTEQGTKPSEQDTVVLVMSAPVNIEKVIIPETPPPPEIKKAVQNLAPVLTDDTTQITSPLLTTDEIINTTKDGDPTDTTVYSEPVDPVIPAENKPFIIVEEMPVYPGGIPALMKDVGENIKYPEEAQRNNIQGKVNLKFVVNSDGSVDRIEILRSIDPLLDNEAIRVVKTLKRFKPGKQGGIPVPVWFSLPVAFKLQNN